MHAADLKVGVVNMKLVINKVPQAKIINERIQKQFKERTDSLVALRKKGEEIQKNAKRDAMTLTNAEKLEVQRKLKTLDSQFNLKQEFLQDDIAIVNKKEQKALLKKIADAVNKVARQQKLDIVITSEAAMFVNAKLDISDKVIAVLSNPAG